jgi:hypothetical protein
MILTQHIVDPASVIDPTTDHGYWILRDMSGRTVALGKYRDFQYAISVDMKSSNYYLVVVGPTMLDEVKRVLIPVGNHYIWWANESAVRIDIPYGNTNYALEIQIEHAKYISEQLNRI